MTENKLVVQNIELTTTSTSKTKFSRTKKQAIAGYLFVLPAILGFLIFYAGPMLISLYYSFTKYSILDKPVYVGLQNYIDILTNPLNLFKKSLAVTMYYAFGNILLMLVFSMIIAVLLNRKFIGRNALRAIYFMPSVLPTVATVVLWGWIMEPNFGLLNNILQALNLPTSMWLQEESTAVPSLLLMGIWFMGGTIVVFLASLQDVPSELLEAVKIDGGNAWHRYKHVVFPIISPVIFFQFIIGIVGSLQVFTQSIMLTRDGAPNHSMYFMNVLIFDDAFRNMKMGMATAESWLLFLIIMLITVIIFKTSRFWVYYQGGGKSDD